MHRFMQKVNSNANVAIVGGSDLAKIAEQLGGLENLKDFDYVFSENGLVAQKKGEQFHCGSIQKFLGEEKLKKFINYTLKRLSELDIPIKRGTFIEFRNGMLNICPIGRNCSHAERQEFFEYDQKHGIREALAEELRQNLANDMGLQISIGGQISMDVFPVGWDKRYCLQFLDKEFKTIHFFGDKTAPGGNDHEVFEDERTIGHKVTSPDDTMKLLSKMLGIDVEN